MPKSFPQQQEAYFWFHKYGQLSRGPVMARMNGAHRAAVRSPEFWTELTKLNRIRGRDSELFSCLLFFDNSV
jgi:hypothetical protein